MKKTLLLLYSFAIGVGVVSAQNSNDKVGINTDNPTATLDVEGGVRLAQPGEADVNKKISPLGIDPTSKVLKKLDFAGGLFLQHKRITLPSFRSTPNNQQSYLRSWNLDIENANAYEVILLNAQLQGAPHVSIVAIGDRQTYIGGGTVGAFDDNFDNAITPVKAYYASRIRTRATIAASTVFYNGNPHILQGKLNQGGGDAVKGERNPLLFPILDNRVYKSGNTWRFEGGFKYASTVESNNLQWVIDVLIINKNFVERRPNQTLTKSSN